jgi:SSS family solute:Na+ symporter
VVYVVVSLMTRPTDPQVMRNWQRRVAGEAAPEEPAERVPAN